MTQQTNLKYIRKAINLEILKTQITLSITKTELNALIADALANPESSAAIKRVLNPLLDGMFPQFPEFTNITLGDTEEDGSTIVVLKQPRESKPTGPIKSIEPPVIDEPVTVTEPDPMDSPDYIG